jgi:hypothetical protein
MLNQVKAEDAERPPGEMNWHVCSMVQETGQFVIVGATAQMSHTLC